MERDGGRLGARLRGLRVVQFSLTSEQALDDAFLALKVFVDEANQRVSRGNPTRFQLDILKEGAFELGSYFKTKRSYICQGKAILYVDETSVRFAVITGNLALGYPIIGVADFESGLCYNLVDPVWGVTTDLIAEIARAVEQTSQLPRRELFPERVAIVCGDPNFAHVLWNELSALTAGIQTCQQSTVIVTTHEPLGPIDELIGTTVRVIRFIEADLVLLNQSSCLSVCLGSTLTTMSTKIEVAQQCYRYAETEQCKVYMPPRGLFSITIRSRNRTASNLPSAAEAIIRKVMTYDNDIIFLLDGHSIPADFTTNPSYSRLEHEQAIRGDQVIAEEIRRRVLGLGLEEDRLISAVGLDIRLSIAVNSQVKFYFSHHGTIQHKVGWIHNVPGIVHSNLDVLALLPAHWVASQSEGSTIPTYIPAEFVSDVDNTEALSPQYQSLMLDNYQFSQIEKLADFVADTFASVAT